MRIAWSNRLRGAGSVRPCRRPKPAADNLAQGRRGPLQSAHRHSKLCTGASLDRSPRAPSEEAGIHLPQRVGEPNRCSSSEEADGPHRSTCEATRGLPLWLLMPSLRRVSEETRNLLWKRPPSLGPGGLGDGLVSSEELE